MDFLHVKYDLAILRHPLLPRLDMVIQGTKAVMLFPDMGILTG
jgi:hypothetical protein